MILIDRFIMAIAQMKLDRHKKRLTKNKFILMPNGKLRKAEWYDFMDTWREGRDEIQ